MFLNFVHVCLCQKAGISFANNQKEEKACLQGCLFDWSLKKTIQKHMVTALTANCSSVNILQTSFDILNCRILIVQEENDIIL